MTIPTTKENPMKPTTSTVYGVQYTDNGKTQVVFAEQSTDLEATRAVCLFVEAKLITDAMFYGGPMPTKDDEPIIVTATATVTLSPWVPVDEAALR